MPVYQQYMYVQQEDVQASKHSTLTLLHQHHRCQFGRSRKNIFESLITQPWKLQEHHRRQFVGSSKTMFEPPYSTLGLRSCENSADASVLEIARRYLNLQSLNVSFCENITWCQFERSSKRMFEPPNTQPWLLLQQHHRRQFDGSSKTMFESPNTQPLQLQQHHWCQFVGSSNTRMFESPITLPWRLQGHHRRVQKRSAAIELKNYKFKIFIYLEYVKNLIFPIGNLIKFIFFVCSIRLCFHPPLSHTSFNLLVYNIYYL